MDDLLVTAPDLGCGLGSLDDVEEACLEPDGKISVIERKTARPRRE
jgi:uncharacterized membrane protein YcaP (DUF421 family)